MQILSKWLLKTAGWKVIVKVDEPAQSVICVAPHTSNWDFLIGKLAYWSLGRKASFLIKKSSNLIFNRRDFRAVSRLTAAVKAC